MDAIPRSARIGAVLPLILGAAACAAGGGARSPSVLSPGWSPPPGQSCNQSPEPKQLPSVAQITDSTALARELAAVPGRGHAVFWVTYDSLGNALTPGVVDSDLPADVRGAYSAVVSRHLRRTSPLPPRRRSGEPLEEHWSVLLRIDAGEVPAFRVGRTEECPPVLINRRALASHITRSYVSLLQLNPSLPPSIPVAIRMEVDSTGIVSLAYPSQPSGYRAVDELAQRTGVMSRFHPARINRKAVPVLVTLPFTFAVAPPDPATSNQPNRP